MELLRIRSGGRPSQMQTVPGSPEFERGVLGAALSPKDTDGDQHTVVQLLLDDDQPGFDMTLLDCPLVAEIRTPAGDVVTRELFDHDRTERDDLLAAIDAGLAAGSLSEQEHRGLRTTIEQRHPT